MQWFKKLCPAKGENPSRLREVLSESKLPNLGAKESDCGKNLRKIEIKTLPQTLSNLNLILDVETDQNETGECSRYLSENCDSYNNGCEDVDENNWMKKWYLPNLEKAKKKREYEEEFEMDVLPPSATIPNTTFWPIVFNNATQNKPEIIDATAPIKNRLSTLHHKSKQIKNDNRSGRRAAHKILLPPTNDKGNSNDDNNQKAAAATTTKTTTDDNLKISQYFGLDDYGSICVHYDIDIVDGREIENCPLRALMWRLWKIKEVTDEFYYNENLFKKLFRRRKKYQKRCGNGGAIDYDDGDDDDGNGDHPRNKASKNVPANSVEAYTMALAKDKSSTFAKNIDNFIACTKESREIIPQNVMRNIRQFTNGMKNYLVKHGEADFLPVVDKARLLLKPDEFLNLDAILERVMHQLIILPLREHLYNLLVDFYARSGDIQAIINNIKYAETKSGSAFGIRDEVKTPSPEVLARISSVILKLQEAELPNEKIDLWLCAVSAIINKSGDGSHHGKENEHSGRQLGADDFLPILVYIIAKCGFYSAEIEAEYMWGLLHPSLLNGESGYYITALCSACHVLKTFMGGNEFVGGSSNNGTLNSNVPLECSTLRVIIPDEYNGSIQTRTIPVRPHTTTKEVCRIIAHKGHITNPQDFGLFRLIDGEETLLMDNDCPQEVRLASLGKHCMLAYKRIDAKIAWPTSK